MKNELKNPELKKYETESIVSMIKTWVKVISTENNMEFLYLLHAVKAKNPHDFAFL